MNRTFTLDYVAGFFDGEGFVTICKSKRHDRDSYEYVLHTGIGNTYLPILTYLKDRFGGYIYLNLHGQKKKASNLPFFQWSMNGRKAQKFLEELMPYLIVKKEQAEIGIAFQRCKSSLKKRGQKLDIGRIDKFEEYRLHLVTSRPSNNSQYTGAISREDLGNQEPSETTRGDASICV